MFLRLLVKGADRIPSCRATISVNVTCFEVTNVAYIYYIVCLRYVFTPNAVCVVDMKMTNRFVEMALRKHPVTEIFNELSEPLTMGKYD